MHEAASGRCAADQVRVERPVVYDGLERCSIPLCKIAQDNRRRGVDTVLDPTVLFALRREHASKALRDGFLLIRVAAASTYRSCGEDRDDCNQLTRRHGGKA